MSFYLNIPFCRTGEAANNTPHTFVFPFLEWMKPTGHFLDTNPVRNGLETPLMPFITNAGSSPIIYLESPAGVYLGIRGVLPLIIHQEILLNTKRLSMIT